MSSDSNPSIAIVTDALSAYAGSEHVLAAVLELYPQAPIYTLVHDPAAFVGTPIAGRRITTSWIDRLPRARTHYRDYLPFMPVAIEQFDLRGYDIVLSFSYAVAHGVLSRPDQLHLSYTYAPLRYAWQNSREYFTGRNPAAWLARTILHYFRLWDVTAAARVDHFAAVSLWTAECIWRAYRREAQVVYPPVDVDRFRPAAGPRGDYYVTLARLVAHKRLDLVVQAFSQLGLALVLIGQGPCERELRKLAGPNVRFAGYQSDEAVTELLAGARALVHAGEEDFGIAMVEAQAAGCPVIALGRGGARETVIDGETGLWFPDPTVESLVEAVRRFERARLSFHTEDLVLNARRFGKGRFLEDFAAMVARRWDDFAGRVQPSVAPEDEPAAVESLR